MILVLLTLLHVQNPTLKSDYGIASSYWPGDGMCGKQRADGKPFTASDNHIAHRWLPLGKKVWVKNLRTERWAKTTVRDRGPFGFCLYKSNGCPQHPKKLSRGRRCPEGYKWVVRTRRRKGECGYYRGIADLTLPVARRIGATQMTPIRLWWRK